MTVKDKFIFGVEVETTRGLIKDLSVDTRINHAIEMSRSGHLDFLAVTDNPGGSSHIQPEFLAQKLSGVDINLIVNVSCKDSNRNAIGSRLWTLASEGIFDILALTGDYPTEGYSGSSQPVFDIDSVGLIDLMRSMSLEMENTGEKTLFNPGCVVSPFKLTEAELMTQLYKLDLKLKSGAKWVVTQIGYDSHKLYELKNWFKQKSINRPLIGSVYILNRGSARFFNKWGIPGVYVSDSLVKIAESQATSRDKGKKYFNEFAARQIAVLKGLGYSGVYISGKPTPKRLDEIINIYSSYSEDDWKQFANDINFPQDDEFYLYRKPKSFNTYHSEYSEKYLESSKKAGTFKQRLKSPITYRIGKFIHDLFFSMDAKGYKIGHVLYKYIGGKKRTSQAFHALEQLSKVPLYGCKDCGDCSLPDIAYLCPESQCVKNQRNGPCGGTRAGMCEIPDKECIWSRAYYRLKPFGGETNMLNRPVVFRDSKLNGTSAWSNTFLGLDHNTKKNRIR